jgi:hypothetical protein
MESSTWISYLPFNFLLLTFENQKYNCITNKP